MPWNSLIQHFMNVRNINKLIQVIQVDANLEMETMSG